MAFLVEHPRTVKEYETVFILKPDIVDDERTKVTERLTGIFERLQGHLLQKEEWGKRKLSYLVKKNSYGIYMYYRYLGYNDLVAELERNLRILEPVIKFMTVKLADDVDVELRKTQVDTLGSSKPEDVANVIETEDDDDDDAADDDNNDDEQKSLTYNGEAKCVLF